MTRAAIYARFSSQMQREASIEDQRWFGLSEQIPGVF